MVNDTKKMQDAYEEFLLSCKAKNLVNETIINYSKSIRYFMNYIGPDFNIYDITRVDVNNYINDMLEKVQSNTIRSYCKLLRVFFKYFDIEIEFNMPSENFHYKDVYSPEEIEKLLQPPKRKNFSTLRDHVMVSFLLGTGVRMRTLITLKVKDVDLVNNFTIKRFAERDEKRTKRFVKILFVVVIIILLFAFIASYSVLIEFFILL